MLKQLTLKVKGQVQGVFYRAETQQKALELGLKGFAKNNPDGSVTICAQGPEEALQKLIEWCRKGPDRANVEEIKIEWQQIEKATFQDFEVR